jgi:hypothetical protein
MDSFSIPQDYNITFPEGISTHLDGNLTTTLAGSVNTNSTAKLIGDPNQPLATLLIGDKNKPIATDSKLELLNLPRFTLQDIKDMMKVRVRIPNYSQICFKLFGQEIFTICMNGEGQVITEPYVPNAMERCEPECCEPDTRPFPGDFNIATASAPGK